MYGHLRICYDSTLKNGWKHISLHGYKHGYTYSPVKNLLWDFHYHFVIRKKWPFIKVGFLKVWPLIDKENI